MIEEFDSKTPGDIMVGGVPVDRIEAEPIKELQGGEYTVAFERTPLRMETKYYELVISMGDEAFDLQLMKIVEPEGVAAVVDVDILTTDPALKFHNCKAVHFNHQGRKVKMWATSREEVKA